MNIKQAIAITKGSELFVGLTDENGNVKQVKVHESQKRDFQKIAFDSWLRSSRFKKIGFVDFCNYILQEGITISPELIEVKHVCASGRTYCDREDETCGYFAFIKEAKEETNEAEETQSAILQDLLDIANSNILPPHLKLKRIYEQFTLKRK